MAEDKPVRKTVRKTTTKRVVKKAASKKVAPVRRASSRRGMTLKFVFIAILVLIIGSVGTFYLGYYAEGSINVTERLSDQSNYVNEDDFNNNERPIPRPNASRPVLEVADAESVPKPEPEVEETATSTDETASSTDTGTEEGSEESTEETETESSEENAEGDVTEEEAAPESSEV